MKKDHFTTELTQTPGFTLDYEFTILSEMFIQNSYIKMMGWILGIIAFVLLFTSVMNYLLIIVGNLVTRSREMAVRNVMVQNQRIFMPSSFPRLWCMWGWR